MPATAALRVSLCAFAAFMFLQRQEERFCFYVRINGSVMSQNAHISAWTLTLRLHYFRKWISIYIEKMDF